MHLDFLSKEDIGTFVVCLLIPLLAVLNFIRMFGYNEPIDKVFKRRFGDKYPCNRPDKSSHF